MRDDAKLSPVWIVGFTGHRHLKDPDAVGGIIKVELERLRNDRQGAMAGFSSVAIGADTLFAEACLSLNIPWRATLPFSLADFREDFNEDQWSRTAELLARAQDVEVVGAPEDRTGAYLRCGLHTVDEADLVMAVWDRNPARGIGGTAEVVSYARTRSKPLILIHPELLTVECVF